MKRPSRYAIHGGVLQDARPVPPRMRAERSPEVPPGTFTASVAGDELVIRCSAEALVTPEEPDGPGDAFRVELRDGPLELSLEWRPAPSFDVGPTDPERTLVDSSPEVMQDPRNTVPTSRAIVRLVPPAAPKASERAAPRPTASRVHVEQAPSWRPVPTRERADAGDDPDGPTRCQPLDDLEAEFVRRAPGPTPRSKASPATAPMPPSNGSHAPMPPSNGSHAPMPPSRNSHAAGPAPRAKTSAAAPSAAVQPDAAAKRRRQLRMMAYLALALCAFSVIVKRHREEVVGWKRQPRPTPSASAPSTLTPTSSTQGASEAAAVAPATLASATATVPPAALTVAPAAASPAPTDAAAAAAAVFARLTGPQTSADATPPQVSARGRNDASARGEPSRTKARRAVDALATASDAEALRLYEELASEPGANPAYRDIAKALRAKGTATP